MLALTAAAQDTARQIGLSVTPPAVTENIGWQRDVYREVDIQEWNNSGLYSPIDENPMQQGLFMRLLTLATEEKVPIYRYAIDGVEQFNTEGKEDIRLVLRSHAITFSEENGRVVLQRENIPMNEVMKYYLREAVFFDDISSCFRTRVTAICPVLLEDDEFGEETIQYPLFWMRYQDVEPYLKDLPIIPDYRNIAEVMPMTDYFLLNRYKGSIIKVSNAFGHSLAQTCETDSAIAVQQQRLEKELRTVRENTYSVFPKPEPEIKVKKGSLLKRLCMLLKKKRKQKTLENASQEAVAATKRDDTPDVKEAKTPLYRKNYDAEMAQLDAAKEEKTSEKSKE